MNVASEIQITETQTRLMKISEQFPDLSAWEMPNGRIRVTLADQLTPVFVDYWKVENVKNGDDAWRYEVSHTTQQMEYVGPYSHPTEKGCWIMARKYFAESGYIKAPHDNSHLTPKTKKIASLAQKMRDGRAACTSHTPQEGDFIIDREGETRRICQSYDDRCQQTTALERSYYVGESGNAHFSGSLYASVYFDRLTQNEQKRPALFWTFKDGQSGAGRGVDLWLNVTVWTFNGIFSANPWEVK